jgi:hypothetical protein
MDLWLRIAASSFGLGALTAYFFFLVYQALRKGSLHTQQGRSTVVVLRAKEPGFFFYTLGLWSLFGSVSLYGWVYWVRKLLAAQ